MADIAQAMRYKIDVKNGLLKQAMTGELMRGDKNANRIIVHLVDGDNSVPLDGVTVTGKFFRGGDGIEIPLEGEANGNEASVLLDEHCYAVDGYFEASVKLTTGTQTRTILTITGNVVSDGEGGILDIENVVPSVADIVAQYQRMQEVTEQTISAMQETNTATSNANTATANANTAAENANTAAGKANAAAKNWGDSTAANSYKLGGKAPEYYLQPRNLLDNSDFRNPVNQRGQTGYVGNQYTVDRWFLWSQNSKASVGLENDHVALNPEEDPHVTLAQRFPKGYFIEEKTYTLAYLDTAGEIRISNNPVTYMESYDYVQIVSNTWIGVRWAALYEGSYTADTLPPYVPKGYAVELAECQRYLPFAINVGESEYRSIGTGVAVSESDIRINIPLPTSPRAVPNISCDGITALMLRGTSYIVPSDLSLDIYSMNSLTITCTVIGAVAGGAYELIATPGVKLLMTSEL